MIAALALALAHFEIQPGDFVDTVEEYSKQADMSVLYEFDGAEQFTTPRVEGDMTARQALEALLAGLPVKAMYPYRRTITLTTTNAAVLPVKPEFLRRGGWAYNCVPPKLIAGMLFNRMGRTLLDMGFINADYYCTKDHPTTQPANDGGWAVTRLPSARLFQAEALLLSTTDPEVLIETPRPAGLDYGPRPSW